MFNKPPEAPRPPLSDGAHMNGVVDALKSSEMSSELLIRNAWWRGLTVAAMLALVSVLAVVVYYNWRVWYVWVIAVALAAGGGVFTYFVWGYLDWIINEIADTLELIRERNEAEIRALDAYMAPPVQPIQRPINQYNIPRRNGNLAVIKTDTRHEKIKLLAVGVIGDRPISEAEWASGAGKIFTVSEWRALIAEFIERGLMRWVNPDAHAQGVEPTDDGWDFFEALAEQASPTPLPERTNGRT